MTLLDGFLLGMALAAAPAALAGLPTTSPVTPIPERFGIHASGAPCSRVPLDRTYGQFQVNLGSEAEVVRGKLLRGEGGEAVLAGCDGRVMLVTNASRADWLLTYPRIEGEVGVVARRVFESDCSVADDRLYVEALFPIGLLEGEIPEALDPARRREPDALQQALGTYRRALQRDRAVTAGHGRPTIGFAAARLEEALFAPHAARSGEPWRAALLGGIDPEPEAATMDIVLSGSDGSVGMFGHIAVGVGGQVYNVYPRGSDRGSPEPVPLADYLFNAQRGQALRRPTWILRLEGLDAPLVAGLHERMQREIDGIQEGSVPYHPTANNCTLVSLRALEMIGMDVAPVRYFTRRFPRPAFVHVLDSLPRLAASGRLGVKRIELAFIPQVAVRITEGGAPNRPLRDRSRID
ncbi:MAG TPA: hypothetical protein VJV23_05550 [Candidatus Polarisedimenticolia bacterium]|nr:hypothetical protein [Candidatus Polarisedimenticolia bacterium]